MGSVMPMLLVDDLDATLSFYRDVLGFEVTFAMRAPNETDFHASVSDGESSLAFGPASTLDAAARAQLGAGVMLWFSKQEDDLDAYYARVREGGARVVEEIADQDWGDRTFVIADPDGYQLCFYKTVRDFDPAAYADWQVLAQS